MPKFPMAKVQLSGFVISHRFRLRHSDFVIVVAKPQSKTAPAAPRNGQMSLDELLIFRRFKFGEPFLRADNIGFIRAAQLKKFLLAT